MNFYENETVSFHCEEDVLSFVTNVISVVEDHPSILSPLRGVHKDLEQALSQKNIRQYPTTRRTTLLHDSETDCFLKVLHPRNLKGKIRDYLTDSARNLHNRCEHLLNNKVKITRMKAYGRFRNGRIPFYVIVRAKGDSLYNLLIRDGKNLPMATLLNVIEEVAKIHNLGYWLGDAHLSDFFMADGAVSSLIDFDNIRKNSFLKDKHLAKDLAGLNHPKLQITRDDKLLLADHYLKLVKISKQSNFIGLVKKQSELRWKGQV